MAINQQRSPATLNGINRQRRRSTKQRSAAANSSSSTTNELIGKGGKKQTRAGESTTTTTTAKQQESSNVVKILEKIFPKINNDYLEKTFGYCNGDILKTIDILTKESSSLPLNQMDSSFDTENMIKRMMMTTTTTAAVKIAPPPSTSLPLIETDFSEIRKKFGFNKMKKPKNSFVRHKANYEKAAMIHHGGHHHPHQHYHPQQQQQQKILPPETSNIQIDAILGGQHEEQFLFDNGTQISSIKQQQQQSLSPTTTTTTINQQQLQHPLISNFNPELYSSGANTLPSSSSFGIINSDLSIFHPQQSSSSSSSPAAATAQGSSTTSISTQLPIISSNMTRHLFDSLIGYRSLFGNVVPSGFFPPPPTTTASASTPNLATSLHGLLPNIFASTTSTATTTMMTDENIQQRNSNQINKSFFDQIQLDELAGKIPHQQHQRTSSINHQLQNALNNIYATTNGLIASNNGWYNGNMMGMGTTSTTFATNNNNISKDHQQ
uniref:Probable serine/threonine-protein kinase tsuA n=1 Tax=Dermatophagoides pteronyssinus TaxID=6956 RepID=A0A6P6YKD8_DERPT|nr:probable serine/threonine-protein kinase tsuA [Dermatophagoides pteronyssinus]